MTEPGFYGSRFLIIGGASKAGTTSLFEYLAGHPGICASSIKETRFFLDDDYPLPRQSRPGAGEAAYRRFFEQQLSPGDDPVFLESTPDYLYSDAAREIVQLLPRARIVFLLRSPVSRLVSWFRYGKQIGRLPATLDFEAYCRRQLGSEPGRDTAVEWRALEQGRYAHYLEQWHAAGAAQRMQLLLFDDLVQDPGAVVSSVCRFAGLDPSVFNDAVFSSHNATAAVRSPLLARAYNALRRNVAYLALRTPALWKPLQRVNRYVKAALAANTRAPEEVDVPDSLMRDLHRYYEADIRRLETLSGRSLDNWRSER